MADYNGYTGLLFADEEQSKESAFSTWNMALWIDNDAVIYQDLAPFLMKTYREKGKIHAEDIRDFALQYFPEGTPDFTSYGKLELVNWYELAAEYTIFGKELAEYEEF